MIIVMRLRNLSEVEAVVSVESDVELNEESIAQYNKVCECRNKAFEALSKSLMFPLTLSKAATPMMLLN